MTLLKRAAILGIIWVSLQTLGCSSQEIVSAKSPNGEFAVVVSESGGPLIDYRVSISLQQRLGPRRKLYTDTKDRMVILVQSAWSPDSKTFGIVEFDAFTTDLLFAYDVDADEQIPFENIKPQIDQELIRRFRLNRELSRTVGFDPVEWVGLKLRERPFHSLEEAEKYVLENSEVIN